MIIGQSGKLGGRYPQPYRDAESPDNRSTFITPPLGYENGSFLAYARNNTGYTLPATFTAKLYERCCKAPLHRTILLLLISL